MRAVGINNYTVANFQQASNPTKIEFLQNMAADIQGEPDKAFGVKQFEFIRAGLEQQNVAVYQATTEALKTIIAAVPPQSIPAAALTPITQLLDYQAQSWYIDYDQFDDLNASNWFYHNASARMSASDAIGVICEHHPEQFNVPPLPRPTVGILKKKDVGCSNQKTIGDNLSVRAAIASRYIRLLAKPIMKLF
jgi:hypothetical protein